MPKTKKRKTQNTQKEKNEKGGGYKKKRLSRGEEAGNPSKFKTKTIKVKIIGVGGGASSIVSEISSGVSKKGVSFAIADTDKRSFEKAGGGIKSIPFGEEVTRGWGTGMNPKIAREEAEKKKEEIKKMVGEVDFVLLIGCLGGGVGSGASQVFARSLKEMKKISLGIFTLPFSFEGGKKMKLAEEAREEIERNLSGVVIMPNEKILEKNKKAALRNSLSEANKSIISHINNLLETISSPGIINIDFADLRTIFSGWGQPVYLGEGEIKNGEKAEDLISSAMEKALGYSEGTLEEIKNDFELNKILFNIFADKNLTIKDAQKVMEKISELNPRAKIIFGISRKKAKKGTTKITLLAVGKKKEKKEKKKNETEEKLSSQKSKAKNKKRNGVSEKKRAQKRGKKSERKKKGQSAIEVKERKEKEKDEETSQDSQWDIPVFLRDNS